MGKGAQQVAEQPPPEPASAASAKASIGRWVVDGEEYDLTEFIPKHPGGMDMFVWANGRDITIPVYTYHKDPARTVLPLLKKYKVRTPEQPIEDVVKHKLGIPHFLLPPGFDAATDIPTYNFDPTDESQLLTTARKRVLAPDVQRTIRWLDAPAIFRAYPGKGEDDVCPLAGAPAEEEIKYNGKWTRGAGPCSAYNLQHRWQARQARAHRRGQVQVRPRVRPVGHG